MEKISVHNLTTAIDGREGDFLAFLLNEYLPFDTKFSFANDFSAGEKVRDMAQSDPKAFARCVGLFVAYCAEAGLVEDDLMQKEDEERAALAELVREVTDNV